MLVCTMRRTPARRGAAIRRLVVLTATAWGRPPRRGRPPDRLVNGAAPRIAEHTREMGGRVAKAAMNHPRPFGRPPKTRAGMRRFMDPRGRLKGVKLDGARVLGLAAGGGWDPVIFAKLGAQTTVFDISPTQLKTVRDLARRQKVKIRLLRGNMKDLSVFKDASFDVVWHCHSLVFIDDAVRVLKEVGRVLAPGGTYLLSTMHPTTLRLYGSYKDGGWSPKITYFEDKPVP